MTSTPSHTNMSSQWPFNYAIHSIPPPLRHDPPLFPWLLSLESIMSFIQQAPHIRNSSVPDTTCILPLNSNPDTANVTDKLFLHNFPDHPSEISSSLSTNSIPSDPSPHAGSFIRSLGSLITRTPPSHRPEQPSSHPPNPPGPEAPIHSVSRHSALISRPVTEPARSLSPLVTSSHAHANVWPSYSTPYRDGLMVFLIRFVVFIRLMREP